MPLNFLCFRSVRCNIELDTPRLIKFSPDNKSFIVSLENGNNIRVYKMNKSEDGNSLKIQQAFENDFAQVSKSNFNFFINLI